VALNGLRTSALRTTSLSNVHYSDSFLDDERQLYMIPHPCITLFLVREATSVLSGIQNAISISASLPILRRLARRCVCVRLFISHCVYNDTAFWTTLLTLGDTARSENKRFSAAVLRTANDEAYPCVYAASLFAAIGAAHLRPGTDTTQRGPGRQGAIAISKEWMDQGTPDTYSCLVEEVEKDLPLALLLTILTMTRG